ncbi:sugar-binding transcriptional regulator [Pseudonocardia endophytica]|uniref:DNA-binding transcriptional regulator LsrR (DeoR family) n=1 Tax=Pseudonocardia endophytica TaxID=401976 RepID=A0A4R1HTD5_PSEEN|nr:sugar-binding domain-containing protein [Pseudonocardia endophytica]TCK24573.1 DNA-binding transcriptional regulator LsrR (DeoR family) [Pseudonocardia endophytica]
MSEGRGVDSWGPTRRLQAADVADRYFVRQHTKVRIAADLGLSRFQVARILDAAGQRGIVRVEITAGPDVDTALSTNVREAYGLRRVLVVPPGPASSAGVATLAADLVREITGAGDVLGLAWSRTVNDMVERLDGLPRCTVVQLCGAYSLPWRRDSSAVAVSRAAALCGGAGYPIYAPLVLPDRDTVLALRGQVGVADALALHSRLDVAVLAVGAWRAGHSTVHDVLTEHRRRALGARGACGEVVGLLFDRDGRVLDTELAHHVVAVGEDQLRSTSEVVALVREPERADAVDAVLRSGLVHTLVADSGTARELIRTAAVRPAVPRRRHQLPAE